MVLHNEQIVAAFLGCQFLLFAGSIWRVSNLWTSKPGTEQIQSAIIGFVPWEIYSFYSLLIVSLALQFGSLIAAQIWAGAGSLFMSGVAYVLAWLACILLSAVTSWKYGFGSHLSDPLPLWERLLNAVFYLLFFLYTLTILLASCAVFLYAMDMAGLIKSQSGPKLGDYFSYCVAMIVGTLPANVVNQFLHFDPPLIQTQSTYATVVMWGVRFSLGLYGLAASLRLLLTIVRTREPAWYRGP